MVAKNKPRTNPAPPQKKRKEQEKTKERFTIENPLLPYLCILFKFSFYLLILLPNPAGGRLGGGGEKERAKFQSCKALERRQQDAWLDTVDMAGGAGREQMDSVLFRLAYVEKLYPNFNYKLD